MQFQTSSKTSLVFSLFNFQLATSLLKDNGNFSILFFFLLLCESVMAGFPLVSVTFFVSFFVLLLLYIRASTSSS